MKSPKKRLLVIAAGVAVIAAVAAGVLCMISLRTRQADLRYLQQAEYTAVRFSMVPYTDMASDATGADFFSYYFAQEAAVIPHFLRNAGELCDYLEAAFGSGNEVGHVYLELIPFRRGNFDRLSTLVKEHPDTIFYILLDAPSMDYWISQSADHVKKYLASYRELSEKLLACSNVELAFVGAQDWLIMNPGNYTVPLATNRDLTRHLALLTWADGNYQLTEDNYTAIFEELENKISLAKTAPASTDLSDWCLVFFGDSVIGNYTDSSSIPNATAALSGCEAYNLGIGGSPAYDASPYAFANIVDSFLKREAVALHEDVIYPREMAAFYENEHDGKQICFVINYGINDYFNGAPVDDPEDPFDLSTYAGALRSGIRKLRAAFPEAVIVLAASNYVDYFSQGQDRMSDEGGIHTDYVEAAGRVAQETNVIFMNNYYDLGVDASNSRVYLSDGCHLGDSGRYLYAQALIRLISLNCMAAEK